MELLDGETLRALLDRDVLPSRKAIEYGRQIADGLAAAHEKRIVHRDLKPENIFVTRDGRVRILDFGLAQVNGLRDEEAVSEAGTRHQLTMPGAVVGTIGYMSPEQVRAAPVDERSDLFSLGAILYEMAAGRRAFRRDSSIETLNAILSEDPPEVQLPIGSFPGLEAIARRCLEKNPDERFQTARDVSFALQALSGMSSRPRRRLHWKAVAAVGALIVTATIGYVVGPRFTRPRAGSEASGRKRIVVLPFDNLGPPADDYFASGLTEEIASRLAVLHGLAVISRNSAVLYAKSQKTTRQIGKELEVDYIMAGSVRWEGGMGPTGRVRITPQLIRVSDDTHVWSDRYERVVSDIFSVQSAIAENVARELDLAIGGSQRDAIEARPTTNLEAYQAYLRGVHDDTGADRVTGSVARSVTQSFEKAVALDPAFALAHARLSQAYSNMYRFGFD